MASFETLSTIPNSLCWSSGSFWSPATLPPPCKLEPCLPPSHLDKHHGTVSNTILLCTPRHHFSFLGLSQILLRLTRRVLQLQCVLEGVVSQIDAVGSKLKMLERKGELAPSPGMVSALQLGPLSSLLLESILFSRQLGVRGILERRGK